MLRVLGAPVGVNGPAMRAAAASIVESHAGLMNCLVSRHLSSQEAFAVLRVCAVPKINHLLRCARPSITSIAAKKFEHMVQKTAVKRLGLAQNGVLDEGRLAQLSLPLAKGGFGLGSPSKVAHIAWYAAQANAAPTLEQFQAADSPARVAESARVTETLLAGDMCGPDAAKHMPPDPGDTIAFFARTPAKSTGLQRSLTLLMNRAQQPAHLFPADDDLEEVKECKQAHYNAITAPKASLPLSILPTSPGLRVCDADFAVMARMRLNLPPLPADECPDACRFCRADLQSQPLHGLTCRQMLSGEVMVRHDVIKNSLVRWLNELGAPARAEPRDPDNPRGSRVDILVEFPMHKERTLVDIVVSHPLAVSHVHRAAGASLAVAEYAAKEKHRKHGPQAEERRCDLVAFSLETFGGWTAEAADFVRSVISRCSQHQSVKWAPSEVVKGVYGLIAMAIVRGNARAIRACARGEPV